VEVVATVNGLLAVGVVRVKRTCQTELDLLVTVLLLSVTYPLTWLSTWLLN